MKRVLSRRAFPVLMIAGLILSGMVTASSVVFAISRDTGAALGNTTVDASRTISHGRALFVAKGCIVCHRHQGISGVQGISLQIGGLARDLTSLGLSPEYARAWLKNPQAIKPNTEMPNLELDDDEVEALVKFLLGD